MHQKYFYFEIGNEFYVFEQENYTLCKKFWWKIQTERRRQGVVPTMPPASEQREILRKYKASLKVNM